MSAVWLAFIPAAAAAGIKVQLTKAAASGAVCLDGTPAAYYIERGSGDGLSKWYIHHEGGGWCESLDDCLARSKMGLGSSADYPDQQDFKGGYFSRDPEENPVMHNWNMVIMKYCDGASFSGDNSTVTSYKNTSLFFRGRRIREAMAQDLLEKGLRNASELIVGGCSAGGLATYLHADQWCDLFKAEQPSGRCVAMPDSGFFIDYQDPKIQCQPESGLLQDTINGNYHCGLKWTFEIQNATAGVNAKCLAANANQEWRCMFAEHAAAHLHTPYFALQSAYDSWQTAHVQGPGGDEKTRVLGKNISGRLAADLALKPSSGAFLDSCLHHCGSWNSIRIDGDLVSKAMQKWYKNLGAKRLWDQDQAFPCKACCQAAVGMELVV